MNENAKKWVAALRSGEFKQTQGRLRRREDHDPSNDGFCCLGVACELFRRETGKGVWRETYDRKFYDRRFFFNTYSGHSELSFVPRPVADWLGLNKTRACLELTALNDTGESFERIADVIEAEPPGLFWVTS